MGQKLVRFGGLRGARSRQDESKEVHEVGSKRPSSRGNEGHVVSLYPLVLIWRSLPPRQGAVFLCFALTPCFVQTHGPWPIDHRHHTSWAYTHIHRVVRCLYLASQRRVVVVFVRQGLVACGPRGRLVGVIRPSWASSGSAFGFLDLEIWIRTWQCPMAAALPHATHALRYCSALLQATNPHPHPHPHPHTRTRPAVLNLRTLHFALCAGFTGVWRWCWCCRCCVLRVDLRYVVVVGYRVAGCPQSAVSCCLLRTSSYCY
jgi:hypothetical protein